MILTYMEYENVELKQKPGTSKAYLLTRNRFIKRAGKRRDEKKTAGCKSNQQYGKKFTIADECVKIYNSMCSS